MCFALLRAIGHFRAEIGQPLLLRADDDIAREARGEIGDETGTQLCPTPHAEISQHIGGLSLDQCIEEALDLPDEVRHGSDLSIVRLREILKVQAFHCLDQCASLLGPADHHFHEGRQRGL